MHTPAPILTLEIAAENLTIHRLPGIPSAHTAPRRVDVWLPPGYDASPEKRFPVLYMHDGQNLFDPATATHGVTWGIAATAAALASAGRIRAPIIAGIWNRPKRWQDYMPQKAFGAPGSEKRLGAFIAEHGGAPVSDCYVRFITGELKPYLDDTFRTLPDRANTFIMGSSMGGLVSLYALCEFPHVFAGAGCLSTHWVAGDGIVLDYLKNALPQPGEHKIYFDYGTETLDAAYEPYQRRADRIMEAAGYRRDEDWVTRKFPGHAHDERAWRARAHQPLAFLLPPTA